MVWFKKNPAYQLCILAEKLLRRPDAPRILSFAVLAGLFIVAPGPSLLLCFLCISLGHILYVVFGSTLYQA